MFRFSKRASLSLSINAIVILVLAITMLGLGLGFTKGMFSKFSSKLEVPPPNIPATPEEQIVIPQETIEVLKNKDFDFTVNFYNDYQSGVVTPGLVCPKLITDPTKVNSAAQNVNAGSYKPFKFIITNIGITGKDICTLQFKVPAGQAGEQLVEKQIILISK